MDWQRAFRELIGRVSGTAYPRHPAVDPELVAVLAAYVTLDGLPPVLLVELRHDLGVLTSA